MHYLSYADPERSEYPICILTPVIRKDEIYKAYIEPFPEIDANDVLVLDLHIGQGKKTPMSEMRAYINEELAPILTELKVEYLLVTDADYFKALTKAAKVEVHLGYIMECAVGPWKVVYAPNYRQIFYDPDKVKGKISLGVSAIIKDRLGKYQAPGAGIIHFAAYPQTVDEIEQWLERLIVEDRPLTCDIEGFSLKHHTAGIGTITLCWSEHEGIAFPVDYSPIDNTSEAPFGKQIRNDRLRIVLRSFFERFRNKLIYHYIAYDVYVLIAQLFMKDILDTEGLLRGLEVMLRDWEDTKLITYLATNSCAGNRLRLKDQAQEFAGNYAVDEIEDIRRIPLPKLLEYNLVDGLSTWYVYKKHWPTLIADNQLDIYRNLFQPATTDIIQMQLTGMPLNMVRVWEVKKELELTYGAAYDVIMNSPIVQRYTYRLNEKWVAAKNEKLKVKRVTIADAKEEFNPNSSPQLIDLLYEFLALPVIARSDSGGPATGGKVLNDLRNYINKAVDPEIDKLLEALVDYKSVNKILTDFIPSMLQAAKGPDGWHYLFGNFNLGGTLSGRLSSSDPNLQNLPANSKYAKLIKSCFQAPPGWLFCGLDFSSLEDRISALTTKDPNKLKVYTDGYDGHSLRAFAYFGDQMPDIRQSNGRRVFRIAQGGETHFLFEGDPVKLPDGREVKIEEICDDTMGKGVAAVSR